MSVDVEDYFQVWAFCGVVHRSSWDAYALRVEDPLRRILDLCDRRRTRATFFTLGWIAERKPSLIREVVARGHEIASHGYDHRKVFELTPEEFRADVAKTKCTLEDVAGVEVTGYRAPGFSLDARTPWAYDILGETGHVYSSSSHPIAHDHYGDKRGRREPHLRNGVIEAPVATVEMLGRRIPCGGGWFRAAPYAFAATLIRRAAATIDGPAIFYFHPWEIDADQPRITAAPAKSKFRHYLNLDRMEGKLDRLLSDFEWRRVDESLGVGRSSAAAA